MTTSTKAKIELGLNIIVVVAIVTVTAVVVKRYVFQGAQQQPRIKIGSQLNVPNVDWEQNKKTLVFFLMEKCSYCESSAPFYRQLIEDAAKYNVKSLAILPLPVEQGRNMFRASNSQSKMCKPDRYARTRYLGRRQYYL